MVGVCDTWGIKHLNLASISVKSIARYIEAEKPQILIASIEMISNVDVQKELSSLSLDYIALDEAQVQDLIITLLEIGILKTFSIFFSISKNVLRTCSKLYCPVVTFKECFLYCRFLIQRQAGR